MKTPKLWSAENPSNFSSMFHFWVYHKSVNISLQSLLWFNVFYFLWSCHLLGERRERRRERKITPATNHPKNVNEKFLCWFHGHSSCVSVRENVLLIWIYFQIHTIINLAHDSKSVAKLCVSNNKWTHELCSHTHTSIPFHTHP